jgi:TonB family protein
MYFDFEDYRPDIEPVGRAISWRDGLILSVAVHVAAAAFLVFAPIIMPARATPVHPLTLVDRPEQNRTFVFVQPRLDMKALKPPVRGENSDQDRLARTVEKAPNPTNPLPFSRGNTPDRVEAQRNETSRGQGPSPQPSAGQQHAQQQADSQAAENTPKLSEMPGALQMPARPPQNGANGRAQTAGGSLGDALKNLQRYVQTQNFENEGGSGQFGPAIQFDTKGVEFGPWIRRFIAQIKRNWFIPYAAMSMKGHVVITFNVHKDGSISDLTVVGPCPVDAFNNAAFGALASSNPTQPLPPEYPADKAFFTVTFYYNENPQ